VPNGTVEFVSNDEEYYFLPIFVAYGTVEFMDNDKEYFVPFLVPEELRVSGQ